MLNFRHRCKECIGCRTWQDPRFCERKDVVNLAGITADGAFAEYVVADADTTVELPVGLSFEQAAPLMCAGVCLFHFFSSLLTPLCTNPVPALASAHILRIA